jgi:hypothetical protein
MDNFGSNFSDSEIDLLKWHLAKFVDEQEFLPESIQDSESFTAGYLKGVGTTLAFFNYVLLQDSSVKTDIFKKLEKLKSELITGKEGLSQKG